LTYCNGKKKSDTLPQKERQETMRRKEGGELFYESSDLKRVRKGIVPKVRTSCLLGKKNREVLISSMEGANGRLV